MIPPGLTGPVRVVTDEDDVPKSMEGVAAALAAQGALPSLPGGRYRPPNCTARHTVAIIVPYKDREANLKTLLLNLHPFLQKQQVCSTYSNKILRHYYYP
jgi:hypothetical protein